MNIENIEQVFRHYIDRFDELNSPPKDEYYKWQIAKDFRDEMDTALKVSPEELPNALFQLKKKTFNLIDSYTQPFYGLVKFAEKEPETVRTMFLDLLREDGGDLIARQNRVREFLRKSHALREKYYPDSYLYKDDVHSVTGYLFLYDPDHNYLYKATHGKVFADCIGFYDDWGSGDTVALDVYYHMCDLAVKEIKSNAELMETDSSRFSNRWGVDPMTLHPDREKHILLFDLIYCCTTYGLFHGITIDKKNSSERKKIQDGREKAKKAYDELLKAQEKLELLEEAKTVAESLFRIGMTVHHKSFGDGIVVKKDVQKYGKEIYRYVYVDFPNTGIIQFWVPKAIIERTFETDYSIDENRLNALAEVLNEESSITPTLSAIEKEFAMYSEYMD